MRLSDLLRPLADAKFAGARETEIAGLTHDSRLVKPGFLFFALQGSRTDGNRHAREAVERGASAVVSELPPPPAPATMPAAWVTVPSAVGAMGAIADVFYGRPSAAMKILGVTGTNGKTTTTYFLESIVSAAGGVPAVAGTVDCRLAGRILEASVNTTPISSELQRLLARFRDGGATHAAIEVSSHALSLGRVSEIDFDCAVFTNLRRDHLDFHKTREEYFAAKARLFELLCRASSSKKDRAAVLNQDDPRSEALKKLCVDARILTFGLGAASLRAESLRLAPDGTRFDLLFEGRRSPARIALVGEHNVYNALGAAAAALSVGIAEEAVLRGLESLKRVPGRLEAVSGGQDFHVFVDYAHTDSALETVLDYLRRLPHKRLLTVFGCGGDRDRTKRGPMGVAACRLSDLAIVTSDNPRTEDPLAIIREIEEGITTSGRKNYTIQADRGQAIEEAVKKARSGDIVLIAGKGHEDTQILKDRTIHFDDREAALSAIRKCSST